MPESNFNWDEFDKSIESDSGNTQINSSFNWDEFDKSLESDIPAQKTAPSFNWDEFDKDLVPKAQQSKPFDWNKFDDELGHSTTSSKPVMSSMRQRIEERMRQRIGQPSRMQQEQAQPKDVNVYLGRAREIMQTAAKGSEEYNKAKRDYERLAGLRDLSGRLTQKQAKEELTEETLTRAYIPAKEFLGGATLGLSDVVLRQIEEKAAGGRIEPTDKWMMMSGGVARLLGTIATASATGSGGGNISSVIKNAIGKSGAVKGTLLNVLSRAATSAVLSAPQNTAKAINGDMGVGEAAANTALNVLTSVASIIPEQLIPPGVMNAVGQVTTDFLMDLGIDLARGRVQDKGFAKWFIEDEAINLAGSIVPAINDNASMDSRIRLAGEQAVTREDMSKVREYLASKVKKDVEKADIPKEAKQAVIDAATKIEVESAEIEKSKAGEVSTVEGQPAIKPEAGEVNQGAAQRIGQVEEEVAKPSVIDRAGQIGEELYRSTPEGILERAGQIGQEMAAKPISEMTRDELRAKAGEEGVADTGFTEELRDRVSSITKSNAVQSLQETPETKPVDMEKPIGSDLDTTSGSELRIKGEGKFDPNERRFAQRVKRRSPEVRAGMTSIDMSIPHLGDADAVSQARELIAQGENVALDMIRDPKQSSNPVMFTAASLMIDDAIKAGDFDKAIRITEDFAPKTTSAAQALQKLSIFGRLTPQGMLRYAETQMAKISKKLKKDIVLSDPEKKKILKWMADAEQAKLNGNGRAHDQNVARALALLAEKTPAGMWQKVAFVQTLSQLLNVKTIGRNIIGNTAFAGMDNVSKTFAVALDKIASIITGKRTTALPSIRKQMKGYKQGWMDAVEDIREGIDTSAVQGSKYDIPRANILTSKIGKVLSDALSYSLRVPDRAAFQAEFSDSLNRQMKARNVADPTPDMIENATFDGLYITFQDINSATKFAMGMKKQLNKLGFGDGAFGLGDLVIKYPKTPANLLMRGIDYSPVGMVKGIMQLGSTFMGKSNNQYRGVLNTSRGIIGTGLMTGAALLSKLGILSGSGEKDKDVEELEKAQGRGRYRVNSTALKRFILSGFNDKAALPQAGDTYQTYDWAQPLAISVGGGATLGEKTALNQIDAGDVVGSVVNAIEASSQTLSEQPLLTGLKKISRKENAMENIMSVLQEVPASFVPALMAQMAQYSDPIIKDVKDRKVVNSMLKSVAKKVPFMNTMVPDRIMSTGKPMEIKNPSLFNIFVNPAIESTYEPTPGTTLVVDIYKRGFGADKKQFPRMVSDAITYNKQTIRLTPEEKNELQKEVGTEVMRKLDQLGRQEWPWFKDPDVVANYIDNKILDSVAERAKIKLIKKIGREEFNRRAEELKETQK